MPGFSKGPGYRTPFGGRNFLRSTDPKPRTESRTVAKGSVPTETIDGSTEKVLRKGEVIAKITSGADSGKTGPFAPGDDAVVAANEVQTITRTATGGTVVITWDGESTAATAVVAATTAAQIKTALETLSNINVGDVTVTGSAGGPFVITFVGRYAATDVPAITIDQTNATGGTVTIAQTTAGAAAVAATNGATDGRQDLANIVGINNTFLPWLLLEREVEVSVVYDCSAIQSAVTYRDHTGARVAITDAMAAAMRGTKGLDILFK